MTFEGDGNGKEMAMWVLRAVFQTEAKKASSVQGTWRRSAGLQWIKRGREEMRPWSEAGSDQIS